MAKQHFLVKVEHKGGALVVTDGLTRIRTLLAAKVPKDAKLEGMPVDVFLDLATDLDLDWEPSFKADGYLLFIAYTRDAAAPGARAPSQAAPGPTPAAALPQEPAQAATEGTPNAPEVPMGDDDLDGDSMSDADLNALVE